MMYIHFIGRIGKDGAKVINGSNGQFLSVDMATDIYTKGENKTLWIRVRSNRENHIKLAEYLTKGRLILVEGSLLEPSIWNDKGGVAHAQLSMIADSINFVSAGQKKNEDSVDKKRKTGNVKLEAPSKVDENPFETPADEPKDAPF